MPKTIRDVLKRKAAQTINHQAQALIYLGELYEAFKEAHPEHAEYLGQLIVTEAKLREGVLSFVKASWDIDEDQIMRYL